MNMAPKPRPLWQRIPAMVGLSVLALWKFCRLPSFFLPRAFRSIVQNWTWEMFWVLISSRITRTPIDQTCRYKPPASFEPRIKTRPEFQLTEDQIRGFHEKGYIGPFDAFSPEELKEFREELVAAQDTVSKTYNFVTPRDRHFEMPSLMEKMRSPAIVDRAAQLLGPDLLSWRSQIFYKMAGAPRIQWHQASTFMVEDYLDPAIFPVDRDELFQLTVWVAIDPATKENGCLEFACGRMDRIYSINFGKNHGEGFYQANFDLEFPLKDTKVDQVEVKPGQFIMFTERCVHGSGPNNSQKDRLAFNFRVIPTNMKVYPNKKYYRSVYNGGKYYLDNWGVVLLRGEDRYKLSRTIDVEKLLPKREERRAARAA